MKHLIYYEKVFYKMKKLLENKVFKIVYGIFRTIVMTFLVAYLLFVIIQRLTNNSSIFGYRVFTVATGSMEPVYMVNDVILVKEVEIATLKVGDDVAYVGASSENKGISITHRIIEITKSDKGEVLYILKGVNNEYEDPAIYGHQILGKVQGKVPVVTLLNHTVKNIYGFFFLVFCPLVLVIFLEIADTIVAMKVEKNELRLKKEKAEENSTEIEMDNEKSNENVDLNISISEIEEIEEIKEVASEIVEELIDAVDGDSCEEEII